MDWRPLSAHGGQVTDVKFDSDGRIIVRSRQEVDPILDMNKEVRNHGDNSFRGDGLGRKIATVPNSILHKWMTDDGLNVFDDECDQTVFARKMNDPDNAYLRTGGGYIGVSNGVAR